MSETNISVPDSSLSAIDCKSLAAVLASVGDKWTIMVVGALSKGSLRYNEIQRRVSGISQRMLTMTLKRLEADGLVTRTLFPSYRLVWTTSLPDLGRHCAERLVVPLHRWAAKNKETMAIHRIRTAGKEKKAGATPWKCVLPLKWVPQVPRICERETTDPMPIPNGV